VSLYDGVVTFDDASVPVIIGVQDDGLSMSSGGAEIGQWGDGEYSIDAAEDGTYEITAENETLRFVPTNPSLFAAGIGIGAASPPRASQTVENAPETPLTEVSSSGEVNNGEAPSPRTTTLVAFYMLAVVTAGLGLWALVSLFL